MDDDREGALPTNINSAGAASAEQSKNKVSASEAAKERMAPTSMSIPESELNDETQKKQEESKQKDLTSNQNKKKDESGMQLPPSMQQLLNKSNFSAASSASSKPPAMMTGAKAYTYATGRGNFPNHVTSALKARGNWTQVAEELALTDSNFYWRQLNLSFREYDSLDDRLDSSPGKPIFVNHFENNRGICTKTGLIRSLQHYYNSNQEAKNAQYTVFDTTPTTFVISRVSDDDEINLLMTRYKEIARGGSNKERVPVKHCAQNMWLVKPASLNQGRGIELFRNLRDINEFIFHKNPQTKSWVVQKYVEHPFLFNGRKFDIRVWAVVTDDYRIYFYKDGYLRTSSAEYNLKDKNVQVHLTNQCLQVKGEGYAQHEEGNTLNYDDLQAYLDEHFGQYGLDVRDLLIPRIKDIIIDTFLCVKKKMNANNRENCFELFGFDFLLDEDFRIWLIEVNYNPFLGTPNEYMKGLVPRMIEDMLKIVLDPVLKPKTVPEAERENDFELIYQDASQKHGEAVNQRRPFTMDLIYPVAELIPFIGKQKNPRQVAMNRRNPAAKKQTEPKPLDLGPEVSAYESVVGEMSSPRKELTSSATAVRSKSTGPQKMFQMRRRTRGSQNYNSQERSSTSVSYVARPARMTKGGKRKKNGEGGIIEQVEEEDKMSEEYDSADDEQMIRQTIKVKRNLLCKNLLDQTKELCYQHSPVYKDFDQIFARIMTRFQDWEIFEDKEIVMACQSLKVVANSGQIVNLVQEKNMKRIIQVYVAEDMHVKFRQEISELFLIIAKNIGLRKIFLNQMLHQVLVRYSLAFVDMKNAPKTNSKLLDLYQNAIKLLCMVCTARKTQFYIPGETNLSERLRKRAFDSGTFTLLTYLYNQLKEVDTAPFKAVRDHIKQQVLNYATMTDLTYHVKLLQYLMDNPVLNKSETQLCLNQNSVLEERKEMETSPPPQRAAELAAEVDEDTSQYLASPDGSTAFSPTAERASGKQNGAAGAGMASWQMSPRGKKARMMKKTSSTNSYHIHQGANDGAAKEGQQTENQKQLYEVDTEKLLMSNDKMTISDLWKAKPQPSFPSFFLKLLDMQRLQDEANTKAANLQKKIEKRKNDEKRKEEQKVQKAAKQREELMEQRRARMEQQEKRKQEQKKFAEELKRRAEQAALIKQQQQQQAQQQVQQQAQQLKQQI